MIVKNLTAKDLTRALKVARALIYFPGADTTLTLSTVGKKKMALMADTAGSKVRATVPCEVEEAGSLLVEMTYLSGLHLTGKTIKIKTTKVKKADMITVKSGRGSYEIEAAEGDATEVKIPKGSSDVQIAVSQLLHALKTVWFGHEEGGTDDLRLVVGKGKLIVETADDFRGVTYVKPVKAWRKIKPARRAVIKRGVLDALLKSFDKDDTVNLDLSENSIALYTSDSLVEHPLEASKLPDVTSMIKSRIERLKKVASFRVKSADMGDVAEAASCVVEETEKFKSVATTMQIKGGKMFIQADGDIGRYATNIPITNRKGKEVTVHMLSKHLADFIALAARTGEDINLELWGRRMILVSNTAGEFRCIYFLPQIRL